MFTAEFLKTEMLPFLVDTILFSALVLIAESVLDPIPTRGQYKALLGTIKRRVERTCHYKVSTRFEALKLVARTLST